MQEVGESEPIVELIGPEGGLGRAKAFSPPDTGSQAWIKTTIYTSGNGRDP